MSRTMIPPEALQWLSVWQGVRAAVVSQDLAFVHNLAAAGHTIFALTEDPRIAARLRGHERVTPLLARPDAIPTDPFQFEVMFVHQTLHTYESKATLNEIARTLRPGGCLSASYLVRDDSVPWVRRLAALLRRFDPMVMRGDYGQDSLATLRESHYFPEVEERVFRVWRPISRAELTKLVEAQPLTKQLAPQQLGDLLSQVLDLYDSAVRPGDTLRLPYQLTCCRAWVDHAELTSPVTLPDSGLAIPL